MKELMVIEERRLQREEEEGRHVELEAKRQQEEQKRIEMEALEEKRLLLQAEY